MNIKNKEKELNKKIEDILSQENITKDDLESLYNTGRLKGYLEAHDEIRETVSCILGETVTQ